MLKFDINLLFTVINLFLLFFVIWRFLFKPVKKIIAKRREEIEKQYADAEAAKSEADAIKAEYEENMKQVADEKASILKESRTQAGKEYEKILADAKDEANEILAGARRDAEADKRNSLKQAKEEIADIVAEAAAKIASTKEDPELDRKLFDDFISKCGD
ncbi:MAG: F0F1 ATP synthase subunit B [Lachnospiraceae bacterium]|nr:F0F1 ATP synthase subunit B [Lachnospiraceae bacterium]